MNNLRKIAENFNIDFKTDVLLSEKTTFKVGGRAKVFLEPHNVTELIEILRCCKSANLDFFILGGGSNLVVSDDGIDKIVISMEKLDDVSLQNDEFLVCKAGASIKKITDFCIKSGFSGLENFAGLPGTCGGAVFMNARCFGASFSEKIKDVKYIDENFQEHLYKMDENDWAYKKSPFQEMINQKKCLAITEVKLFVKKGDTEKIRLECEKNINFRKEKGHYKLPSAGSVFKNNHDFGKPSGKIIDECGLRGLSVGGAQVAPWHGNFIVNNGNATARDIKELVEKIQKIVKEKTGFSLECEIIFVDNKT